MAEETFTAGDVVQLKSGGPIMTVRWCEDQYGTLTAFCDWFEGTKDKNGTYMPAQLRKVDPPR
jgi:uncharacterized protein YodC (DUF2158 family)